MPYNTISDEVFAKERVPKEETAKEFDENDRMDDSTAFGETTDQSQMDDTMRELEDVPNWRAAKSLKQLQAQVNAAFPNRNKASDGMIGDTAHCPGSSDHCPNVVDGGVGVVTAYDITHDPNHGCDMGDVTQAVIDSRDSRIKYIIYNHRICSSYAHDGIAAWTWRPYSGSNPHTKHAHFSVVGQRSKYDDISSWDIGAGVS